MNAQHYKASQWVAAGVFDALIDFEAFEQRVDVIPEEKDRGDVFEIFIEGYLATQTITQHTSHWIVGNIPLSLREKFKLPRDGTGIDGIYETHDGSQIAYQVKYRQKEHLTFAEVAPFLGLTEQFKDRVIFTNASKLSDKAADRTRWVSREAFLELPTSAFQAIEAWLKEKPAPVTKAKPDPNYQVQALTDIQATLASNDRATVVMACGTGKTLMALWAAEQAKPKTVLVLLPSLTLLKQTLSEWSRHTNWSERFSYICVCSDQTVAPAKDEWNVDRKDVGFRVDTDPLVVKQYLELPTEDIKVVFSTYQSSQVVGEGTKDLPPFNLVILDEAHKTTGHQGTAFTYPLSEENIRAKKRLFFTATPRHIDIRHRDKEGEFRVSSMDDETVYGPRAHTLSFATAAKKGIICPYKVIVSYIDKVSIDNFSRKHGITLVENDEVATRWMANVVALRQAVERVHAKKIISFHSRVRLAQEFASDQMRGISQHLQGYKVRHVNGEQNTAVRAELIRDFAKEPKSLLTNARCLTEGVDIPAVDMVAFIDPRHSRIDIAQAVGRAMRKPRGKSDKTVGYVMVPIFAGMDDNATLDEAVQDSRFDAVADVLNALQEHDEDLVEIIRQIKQDKGEGKPFNPKHLSDKIEFIGPRVEFDQLKKSIGIAIADRIGVSWDEWFGLLLSWREQFGKAVPEVSEVYRDYKLGGWAATQRSNYIRASLSSQRIKKLESLDGWTWDLVDDLWKRGLACLQVYWKRHKTTFVPDRYVDRATDLKLGQWVKSRRLDYSRGRLLPQKIMELEKFPDWSWDPNGDAWKEKFNQLKQLLKTHSLEEVERSRKSKASSEVVTLATWIVGQKARYLAWQTPGNPAQKYRRQLTLEEITALESLSGWSWDRRADAWKSNFALLKLYLDDHSVECLIPDTVFRGVALGRWNTKQRAAHKRGTLESWKLDLLIGIGWDPDPFATAWEQAFSLLQAYVEEFKTGYVPQATVYRGFTLGRWVSGQRNAAKVGKLTQARHSRLAQIPGWSWDASSQSASGISKKGLSPSKLKKINS